MIGAKRTLAVLAVAALVMASIPQVAAAYESGGRGVKNQLFGRWDIDKNEKLTPDEWRGSLLFSEVDTDADGFVTLDEFRATKGPVLKPPRAVIDQAAEQGPMEGDLWTQRLASSPMKMSDREKEDTRPQRRGRITSGQVLEVWDVDGDGRLSAEEWHGDRAFPEVDLDGDGFLAGGEVDSAAAQLKPTFAGSLTGTAAEGAAAFGRMLTELDGDGDGRVSSEEWTGSRTEWDALDRDRDGFLTAEEVE